MKRKHLIGGLILSAFMSLGAVVAFNSAKNESKEVKADIALVGSLLSLLGSQT